MGDMVCDASNTKLTAVTTVFSRLYHRPTSHADRGLWHLVTLVDSAILLQGDPKRNTFGLQNFHGMLNFRYNIFCWYSWLRMPNRTLHYNFNGGTGVHRFPIKTISLILVITYANVERLSKFFHRLFPRKLAIDLWQKVPALIHYVAALPCEIGCRYSEYFTF